MIEPAHLHMARLIAIRVARRLPRHVEIGDVISAAYLGLADAAMRFKPERGVPFGAYARRRILGAILDDLRERDMLPRLARRAVREGRSSHAMVQIQHTDHAGRRDRDEEWHPRRARAWAARSEIEPYLMTADPAVELEHRNATAILRRAIVELPHAERMAVIGRYHLGLSQASIGLTLGVHQATISRLEDAGRRRLRASCGQLASL